MNVLAILKDFTSRCKSVFENTTTKMSKRFLNWLILTIRTVALIPGKVNFTRLSRYGGRTAKTFASNFKSAVGWINVNIGIARENFGNARDDIAIAIDPSFISKAGRLTYGMGRFWSGVAQRVKRGLEIMAIGAISLSRHACVMLGAIQSPNFKTLESEQNMSMLDWYISLVKSKAAELLSLTGILVADAFFSKYKFVNEVVAMGFRFVGRLRANSYLRYLAIPDPSAPRRRGRKKTYGEKVDFADLDMSVFTSFIYKDSKGVGTQCHTAVVNSRALKRNIRIVICPVEGGEPLLYFSTDTEMKPERIIGFYRTRFQIEFGIRDAKQFTGLQSQQTRDKDRLDFAFNLSFTTLNVCKEVIRKDCPDLSVAQFKRLMFESYLASTIISTYGKSPHLKIIQKINHRLAQLAA
ncbi:MAG: transposase [Muribaculaceae bacterium]|nr:transposase [Muribaculaceae bacterium]